MVYRLTAEQRATVLVGARERVERAAIEMREQRDREAAGAPRDWAAENRWRSAFDHLSALERKDRKTWQMVASTIERAAREAAYRTQQEAARA